MTYSAQIKDESFHICNRSYWIPSRSPNTISEIFIRVYFCTVCIHYPWNVREACQISLLNMCMEAERTAVCRARGVYLESFIQDVRVMSSLPLDRKGKRGL